MYFENSETKNLVMKVAETLRRVNQNRKVLGASELPISQIIAPLYWRLTTSRDQNPDINNFIDDLTMYPDFDVKLQNNALFVQINPASFDLILRLRKAQKSGNNTYASPDRYYIISFAKTRVNDEEFWEFELRKVIDFAKGLWEPHNVMITSDENIVSYYDFIEQFDDYCNQAKEVDDDKA